MVKQQSQWRTGWRSWWMGLALLLGIGAGIGVAWYQQTGGQLETCAVRPGQEIQLSSGSMITSPDPWRGTYQRFVGIALPGGRRIGSIVREMVVLTGAHGSGLNVSVFSQQAEWESRIRSDSASGETCSATSLPSGSTVLYWPSSQLLKVYVRQSNGACLMLAYRDGSKDLETEISSLRKIVSLPSR